MGLFGPNLGQSLSDWVGERNINSPYGVPGTVTPGSESTPGDAYISNDARGILLGVDDVNYFAALLQTVSGIGDEGDVVFGDISGGTDYVQWDKSTGTLTIRGTLAAEDITAGTLTGFTIQTATSGSRVLMNSSGLFLYDDTDIRFAALLATVASIGDAGDVVIGNISGGGNYVQWDESGGVLTIRGTLNADDITAGTLTGRTVNTATSGSRVEMNSNGLFLYDSTDIRFAALLATVAGIGDAGDVTFGDVGTGTNYFKWDESGGTLTIRGSLTADNLTVGTLDVARIGTNTISDVKLTLENAAFAENLISNGSFESWSSGTSAAPDGWTLTGTSATIARTTSAGDIQALGQSAAALTNGASNAADLGNSITVSTTVNTHLRGVNVTATMYVKCSTASRATIKVDDGVGTSSSSAHSGGGTYELLNVTHTMSASATKLELSIEISSGAAITVTVDGAMVALGSAPVAFAQSIKDQQLVPRNVQENTTRINDGSAGAGVYEAMSGMSIANVIVNTTQSVEITFSCAAGSATSGGGGRLGFEIRRDGTRITDAAYGHTFAQEDDTSGSETEIICINYTDRKPGAGNYTYSIGWSVLTGGSGYAFQKVLSVKVIPDV